mmetsp:Transcript_25040/g.73303  ORF Transcript_25040/g.73303 Transcript_25040/m.73303 type:complete len:404 (-) Transcript_25040:337-1548(-)|eukprot:CAMPEP_0113545922 /NCGR_PEP_ID=MMETSP0015_2-20120614/11528_1 /TAXON_ID=2838 /ORGANISM="Odontella" /LENGTH=403 /DNA_ID=CAMNT_0000446337 /DNA_START=119 /DNA_END=1330 /DNA_ORIENTATION=+ /assembly_acc=CAM_ASM_000160
MPSAAIDVVGSRNYASGASSPHVGAIYATPVPVSAPSAELDERYPSPKSEVGEAQLNELQSQGFTYGLANALSANSTVFPVRFWVIDNSGSMNKPDGHRIIETTKHNNVKIVPCTRWEELREGVNYHAQLSSLLIAPTIFRLLNNPGARVGRQEFSVAESGAMGTGLRDYQEARSIMNKTNPSGLTPLNDHIMYIQERIRAMAPALERDGKKAVIVLATDGLPTDEMGFSSEFASSQLIQSMRLLEGLPVWIVIRLCTDEEEVVSFYNDIDQQLELSIDVLDDLEAEAQEVYEFNPWLNYALPLHRIREFGFYERVFDLIDERKLTKSELRQFCLLLFGEAEFDGVPDPSVDWLGFLNEIERMLRKEKAQWNPIKKKVLPWIDTKQLNKMYGDSSCGAGCVIQ